MLNSAPPFIVSYLYDQVEDTNDIFPNPETEIEYDDKMEDNLAEIDRNINPALVDHHHISLEFLGEVGLDGILDDLLLKVLFSDTSSTCSGVSFPVSWFSCNITHPPYYHHDLCKLGTRENTAEEYERRRRRMYFEK